MTGLLFLVPIALMMGICALVAFLWSLRSGQYEDLEGASERIFEDDLERRPRVDTDQGPPQAVAPTLRR